MLNTGQKPDPIKRRFTLPNEVYSLGLSAAEIVIYGYLLYRENRKTYQCWPSYTTIGEAVRLSPKTVKKYVAELVDKKFITTEHTTVITKDGRKQNGTLLYTILPIQEAVDEYHRRQMVQLEKEAARRRAQEKLNEYDRKHPKPAA